MRGSRAKLLLLAAVAAAMLVAPSAAWADATLSPGLGQQAAANPDQLFKVIVQGERGMSSQEMAAEKPFTFDALAQKVRKVLDAPPATVAA